MARNGEGLSGRNDEASELPPLIEVAASYFDEDCVSANTTD